LSKNLKTTTKTRHSFCLHASTRSKYPSKCASI